jgi:hypothetical protein
MTAARRLSLLLALAAVAAAACGCGRPKGRPDLVPVRGRLTVDGTPVGGIVMTFRPVGETRGVGGHAFTDSDGRFEVMYARGNAQGTAPGDYEVESLATESSAGVPQPLVAVAVRTRPVTIPAEGADLTWEFASQAREAQPARPAR